MRFYDIPENLDHWEKNEWVAYGTYGIPAVVNSRKQPVPVLDGVNILSIGVTGTGKTTSLTIPAAKLLLVEKTQRKAIFFEVKHSFLDEFLTDRDRIIAYDTQAYPEGQVFHWNLIQEIKKAKDPEAEMRQISDFLFRDLLQNADQNLSWIESARNTFVAVLRTVVECFPEMEVSNRTLIYSLRHMSTEAILKYIAHHPDNLSLLEKDFGYDPYGRSPYQVIRRAEDIMFFFNRVLDLFSGSFVSDGQDTIHDFLHTDHQNLFIVYDLATSESSRPFILYFFKKIKDEKMSNTSDVRFPILLCLDEIDKLSDGGNSADFGLFQAATLGREYGLQILLTTQSLENLYGLAPEFNSHIANGGLAGFPIIAAFRPGDVTTIEHLQRLWGSTYRRHLILPASRYESPVIQYERASIVTDADFAALKTGECYIKILSSAPQKVSFILQE